MRRLLAPWLGVVLLGVLGACGSGGDASSPDVVEVTCSPEGTLVSGERFAAKADGLHVRIVNSSGEKEGSLFFGYGPGGRAGGSESFVGEKSVVIVPPPGELELSCAYDLGAREDEPVEIEVVDPAGSWRDDGLEEIGCTPPDQSAIDWVYRAGQGANPEAALERLAAQFDQPVTWRHVRDGWADATRQTWVYLRADRPWATASVTETSAGTFEAVLGSLCAESESRK